MEKAMVQRVELKILQSDFSTLNGDPTAFRGGWGILVRLWKVVVLGIGGCGGFFFQGKLVGER